MFDDVVDEYHAAVRTFSRGDPHPVKELYSHGDDVTLANPFGPAVHGWEGVSGALDFAASRFADGEVTSFESGPGYRTDDLAAIFEVERWQARVGGRDDFAAFELRATTIFRREDGAWRLVHRHADPISTTDPDGPLRS